MSVNQGIAGQGGKGGGGGRAAREADNTLRSRQWARVIDLLCEGEVQGLVGLDQGATARERMENAERSIYLDGVPLRNSLGTPNFDLEGISWAFVPGTQDQSMLPVGGTVVATTDVGIEVRNPEGPGGGGPVVQAIPETYLDSCRVTLMVPALTEQNTQNGDLNGSKVEFAIDVQTAGQGFVERIRESIEGKTNSEYQRSYEFDLPGEGPWDVRVRRLTPNSESTSINNKLFWSTLSKITKSKLRYPNTALMGLRVDSSIFSSVPSRSYLTRLLKVRIPEGYDPITRTYPTFWNGNFDYAWTDNPAWCWYDLATNERYGLGQYIDTANVDKWALYEIAKYCDEMVSDGRGGMEPRFTCNLLLQTREEAIKVLMNMASIFRGIVYWHTNSLFCSQDRPSDPVKLFTPANIVDGAFSYTGSARQARHTVAMVSWNDPDNLYKQTVEYVENREAILRLGVRETEVTAMGCTSRGQAHRLGLWTLLTEQFETETITFRTGLEGIGLLPGDVFQTTDPDRSGLRMGGRLLAATTTSLTLDAPVTLQDGGSYRIAVMLPSGAIEERLVAGGGGVTTDQLTVSVPFSALPQRMAMWILSETNLVPELWRVISISEPEQGMVEVTALEHIPGKYQAIEQNLKLEERPVSGISIRPGPVRNLTAVTDVKQVNEFQAIPRILVSWTPPEGSARFILTWSKPGDNAKTGSTFNPSFEIENLAEGTYSISVTAENRVGLRGPTVTISHEVGAGVIVGDVTGVRLNDSFSGPDCPIAWDRVPGAFGYKIRVRHDGELLREDYTNELFYTYTYNMNVSDGGPYRSLELGVKVVSARGESGNWALVTAENPAPGMPEGVLITPGAGQVSITAQPPMEEDLVGMLVWGGNNSSVGPNYPSTLLFRGNTNHWVHTGIPPLIRWYYRVAFYDSFGEVGLNVSSAQIGAALSYGGIVSVDTLPDSPEDVGGELAVFLDSADPNKRGLWGWDGTQWLFTRDGKNLVENSVTADRIYAVSLKSISANMGDLTSGSITLHDNGFIRGGALEYSIGNGYWLGYDEGIHKFRVGRQNGSGIWWDGTALKITGPQGYPLLSTGTGFNLNNGLGVNLTFNGNYIDSLVGTTADKASDGTPIILGRNRTNYTIYGEGVAFIEKPNATISGVEFEARVWAGANKEYFPVLPGRRYEAYAYMRNFACTSVIGIAFFRADGEKIVEIIGPPARVPTQITNLADNGEWNQVSALDSYTENNYWELGYSSGETNSGSFGSEDPTITTTIPTPPDPTVSAMAITSLGDMVQHLMFATSPPDAVKACIFIRGTVETAVWASSSIVFFTRVYFGEAGNYQTDASPWTPGRGLTQINPDNVDTSIADGTIYTKQVGRLHASNGFLTIDTKQFQLDEQGNASFAGNLVAASGMFAGTLAAGIVNANSFEAIELPPFTVPGEYTIEVPTRPDWTAVAIKVTLQGAGGGGGGSWGSTDPKMDPFSFGGGGGAGRQNLVQDFRVTPGQTMTIIVGAGGAGGEGSQVWNGERKAQNGFNGGLTRVVYGDWAASWVAEGGIGGLGGYFNGSQFTPVSGVEIGGQGTGYITEMRPNIWTGVLEEVALAAPGAGGASLHGPGGTRGARGGTEGSGYAGGNGGTGAGGGGAGLNSNAALIVGQRYTGGSSKGGRGGDGIVRIEFYDPNTVVRNERYSQLITWLEGLKDHVQYNAAIPEAAQ